VFSCFGSLVSCGVGYKTGKIIYLELTKYENTKLCTKSG
jgi:hypothetical protein